METMMAQLPIAESRAACGAALNIVELLEMILLKLSPNNIYGDQRESKLWQTVIATSPGIQRKLYLRPKHLPTRLVHYREEPFGLSGPLTRMARVPHGVWTQRTDTALTLVTLNPMLQTASGPNFSINRPLSTGDTPLYSTTVQLAACLPVLRSGLWADTHVTDPPCMAFRVWRLTESPMKDDYDQEGNMLGRWIIREQGVRIGDVLEVFESELPG
ncbi:hypothetical protein B0A48_06652 [Cryoendolithus antarcticus]|uniref:Uncharacterized protein n=1 Tax=Cryoendolithus antarcticus TaxID=1507870 RepID=A0A1V8T9C7_9PEZI|nr:hypothetical protein B0A48_06652 [Cryoendolithus antarcticus]